MCLLRQLAGLLAPVKHYAHRQGAEAHTQHLSSIAHTPQIRRCVAGIYMKLQTERALCLAQASYFSSGLEALLSLFFSFCPGTAAEPESRPGMGRIEAVPALETLHLLNRAQFSNHGTLLSQANG